ncbi:putative regulator of reproduction DopA [Metarhizium acridum CQMa 102]|uniref:Putative regulator of reproduction DopA n=1 Tax=Metarhizium acridum (strain CQMa 102) TaxID=655827 RepID=E9E8G4_METAQ|nr:putative regulator of reproduction DopA [Metarhizium acridum CQMa 102]EFY87795.1 putative regulator of reproduction DopA [Metarhizium acridum CQMa 102]
MALDPGSGAIAGSPESSGRDSPIPRQWRNQLGGEETPSRDKAYRRYAAGVEKTLSLFETALEEWADYISFLNKLLKSLQARPPSIHSIPTKALVAKRLSQCLNPALPSGVHQKALELYSYIFTTIGTDGLSRDLPLYLPGLAPTLSFASLSVRSPYLDLLETHFLDLDPRSLRPAMKSIILALLPGLEEETSEDFDRTLHLVARFKEAIRPLESVKLGAHHASGDDFFWQCFFLAAITSHSRRFGALAYLVRYLPKLGPTASAGAGQEEITKSLHAIVTSPEPGLLVRCFASGLGDEQLLIQRGFLDLLVSHLPLNSDVLQSRVKPADLELLVKAAVGVVIRRDMSLNRRLWAWLLGPEPTGQDGDHNEQNQAYLSSRTTYFEDFGLQPLTRALLQMIKGASRGNSAERARPYRICLSLMDRWEIGGLVVPEIFMPVVDSVRKFQAQAASKSEFDEVLRSASVFFDGIESGLIYSEIVGLLAQAIGPGSLNASDRMDKLALVNFIASSFNVREEEMITIHAPLTCLAALLMLEDSKNRKTKTALTDIEFEKLCDQVLGAVVSLLELVPERAFPQRLKENGDQKDRTALLSTSNVELLKKIKTFYVHEQGNLESSQPPFTAVESGELLLEKAVIYICDDSKDSPVNDIATRVRILTQILSKTPGNYHFDAKQLVSYLHCKLSKSQPLLFSHFSAMVMLSTQLYSARRIQDKEFSDLVGPLVRHAWSYLSASEPKYHVETVRCLWQLQTALTLSGRDIEAAIAEILTKPMAGPEKTFRSAENGRTFGVLWSHSLQDVSSERRGSKGQTLDQRQIPRLSGTDHYQVMLTQPMFLVLDALLDDRTQTYMVVKSWLNSMIGIDRLFLIFAMKMAQLPFLNHVITHRASEKVNSQPTTFTEDDDLDLCLYYLRTLHNVLKISGDMSRAVLASKYVSFIDGSAHIRAGAEEDEMTLQDFFVRNTPESTLIYLLNGLEQVLALAHDQLLAEEARTQLIKGPEQPSSLFGSMVSGVFQSEGPQSRSATANDRLTVHLAFQDAMRICYAIWSWGQGDDSRKQDPGSSASFGYTSLRMRNRARRLMEHLFTAEILECLETITDIWRASGSDMERTQIFNFLSSLDACRPRHSIPALFNAIYSRTNPNALDPARKSTLTISLQDSDLVVFLVEYSRSLEDDAMDEIWQDCMTFLKDLLGNPFPHRQTLPSLLEFAAILGEKVDNTNFGEQRRMRRELGDIFLRLLAALFTTRPLTFTESGSLTNITEKSKADGSRRQGTTGDGPDDVVSVLASVVPNLSKILLEPDRVLSAAGTISTNVVGPTLRSKSFPDTVTSNTLRLFHELSRLQNNQKTWKKDVGDSFNDNRFFGMNLDLVKDGWLPLLKQWVLTDKERMPEIVARISAPTTAGIVFGVGATSARLEADRKTQLNLRRIATLVLAAADDGFVAELPTIFDKLVELLSATSTSSPSSTTRADVYMVIRALVLKTSPMHLAMSWPVVNGEIHAAISSVVAPDHSAASDMYLNTGILQACKLLDLLICVAPDDFQLHEWLFITDTIEAVYRSSTYQPIALVDELSEELGSFSTHGALQPDTEAHVAASGPHRRPLLGPGGINDDVSLERKDELVAKILRPFFGQLSIYAFESTYAMGALDREACIEALLKDLFDERTMVRAL